MTESPLSGGAPPFSRPLSVACVGDAGVRLHHTASEAECAALAELDGLVGLRDLAVEADVSRRGKDGLHVSGRVTAVLTQTCVVTLEPFETGIDETFAVDFAPEAEAEAAHRRAMEEIEAASDKAAALLEQRDPPDPIVGGKIDLGALAAEFLALGLDPYPRSPGARFEELAESAQPEKASPFIALAGLKKD